MSLSKSKCWYSNNCLHFLKCAVTSDVYDETVYITNVKERLVGRSPKLKEGASQLHWQKRQSDLKA